MKIRRATPDDSDEWLRMRSRLWPDSRDQHPAEIAGFFAGRAIDIEQVFVLRHENSDGLGGFVEINVRDYAEGSRSSPVAYLEAWYVDEDRRGQGYGRLLIERAERWALEQGFDEIASDTELTNSNSIAAHHHLGYRETERIVCFLKKLRR